MTKASIQSGRKWAGLTEKGKHKAKGLEYVILTGKGREDLETIPPTRVLTTQVYQEFIFSYVMLPYFLGEIIWHKKKYILAFTNPYINSKSWGLAKKMGSL